MRGRLLVCLGLASLAGAAGGDPVVQLPTFVVRDTRILPAPDNWRYAAVPGFEILSGSGNEEAKRLTEDFLLFHRAIESIWPLTRMNADLPASLILCSRLRQFAPFAPTDDPARAKEYLSLSFKDREMASIVIELDPNLLADQGDSPGDGDDATADILRREYIHFVLERIGDRVPPFLQQGLWAMFTAMRCSGDRIGLPGLALGAEVKTRQRAAPDDLAAALSAGAFYSLPDLFSPSRITSEEVSDPWSRESYEFAYLCLFGQPDRYRKPFLEFAYRSSRQPVSEELFRTCFGVGYDAFLPILWGYTGFADDRGLQITAPGGGAVAALPPVKFRAATDGESGRIKGETLRMEGEELHLAQKIEAAHWALIAPYQRGSRDPQLLAALGLQELAAGQTARARRFLEAATAGGTTRARAWQALADLRLEAAQAAPSGPNGRLSTAQLVSVLSPLFTARKLPPPLPEVYRAIAEAWSRSPIAPTRAHLGVVNEGVVRFPYDTDLVCADIAVHRQYGYVEDAKALAAAALNYAPSAAARQRIARSAK